MKIEVKQIRASYRFDFFDNEWYCNHDNLEVIQPCCSGKEAEWCGCQGEPEFYCPNPDCDGIEDEVVNICAREELIQCLAWHLHKTEEHMVIQFLCFRYESYLVERIAIRTTQK